MVVQEQNTRQVLRIIQLRTRSLESYMSNVKTGKLNVKLQQ